MDKTQHYYELFGAKIRNEGMSIDALKRIASREANSLEKWDMQMAIVRLMRTTGSQSEYREQMAERA